MEFIPTSKRLEDKKSLKLDRRIVRQAERAERVNAAIQKKAVLNQFSGYLFREQLRNKRIAKKIKEKGKNDNIIVPQKKPKVTKYVPPQRILDIQKQHPFDFWGEGIKQTDADKSNQEKLEKIFHRSSKDSVRDEKWNKLEWKPTMRRASVPAISDDPDRPVYDTYAGFPDIRKQAFMYDYVRTNATRTAMFEADRMSPPRVPDCFIAVLDPRISKFYDDATVSNTVFEWEEILMTIYLMVQLKDKPFAKMILLIKSLCRLYDLTFTGTVVAAYKASFNDSSQIILNEVPGHILNYIIEQITEYFQNVSEKFKGTMFSNLNAMVKSLKEKEDRVSPFVKAIQNEDSFTIPPERIYVSSSDTFTIPASGEVQQPSPAPTLGAKAQMIKENIISKAGELASKISEVDTTITKSSLLNDGTKLMVKLFYAFIATPLNYYSPGTVEFIEKAIKPVQHGYLLIESFNWCKQMIQCSRLYWQTGDWNSFYQSDRLTQWIVNSRLLIDNTVEALHTNMAVDLGELSIQIQSDLDMGKLLQLSIHAGDKEWSILSSQLLSLKSCLKLIKNKRITSAAHAPPFGVQIQGGTSIGKSSIAHILCALNQRINNRTVGPGGVYSVAPMDKYDSSYDGNQTIAMFDDIGAVHHTKDKGTTIGGVINMSNIMATFANKADVEDKGTLVYNFDMIICTSNKLDMGATNWFSTPAAYLRRWQYVVDVYVRPKHSMLDDDKRPNLCAIDHNTIISPWEDMLMFRVLKRIAKGGDSANSIGYILVEPEKHNLDHGGTKYCDHVTMLTIMKNRMEDHRTNGEVTKANINGNYALYQCSRCDLTVPHHHMEGTFLVSVNWLDVYQCLLATVIVLICFYVNIGVLYTQRSAQQLIVHGRQLLDQYGDIRLVTNALVAHIENKVANRMKSFLKSKFFSIMAVAIKVGITTLVSYKIYNYVTTPAETVKPTMLVRSGNKEVDIQFDDPPVAPFSYPRSKDKRLGVTIVKPMLPPCVGITTNEKMREIIRNQLRLLFIDGNRVTALMIYKQFGLTVRHVFPQNYGNGVNNVSLRMYSVNKVFSASVIHKDNVYRFPTDDLSFFWLHYGNPPRDIRNHISYPNLDGILDLKNVSVFTLRDKAGDYYINELPAIDFEVCSSFGNTSNGPFVTHGMKAKCVGIMEGDSGSPVICFDGPSPRIIGIQSAVSVDFPDIIMIQFILPFDFESLSSFDTPDFSKRKFPVLELSSKATSLVQHLIPSNITYYGPIEGYSLSRPSTDCRPSQASKFLLDDGYLTVPGFLKEEFRSEKQYTVPIMTHRVLRDKGESIYVNPQLVSIAQIATPKVEVPVTLLKVCLDDYCSRFESLPTVKCGPLNIHEVINGIDDITPMTTNTAAGFRFPGKKKDYMVVYTDENGELKKRLRDDVLLAYIEYEKRMFDGTAPISVYKVSIKSEIIAALKMLMGKERGFNGPDLFHVIFTRRYLLPMLNIVMQNPFMFECFVGVNAMGPSWGKIKEYLTTFQYNTDGDFPKFDKDQMRSILCSYIIVLEKLARKMSWTERDIYMMKCAFHDIVYHFLIVETELLQPEKSNPSGSVITTIINSFVTSMLIRIAWYTNYDKPFSESNRLGTFGDDHINNTKNKNFTFKVIKHVLALYKLGYTTAAKDNSEPDFVNINDIYFLKRKFYTCNLKGNNEVLCPLEENSIVKMLSYTDVEKSMENLIMIRNIIDAHKQYWFYGKEMFVKRKAFLQSLMYKCDYKVKEFSGEGKRKDDEFACWEDLYQEYKSGTFQMQFI